MVGEEYEHISSFNANHRARGSRILTTQDDGSNIEEMNNKSDDFGTNSTRHLHPKRVNSTNVKTSPKRHRKKNMAKLKSKCKRKVVSGKMNAVKAKCTTDVRGIKKCNICPQIEDGTTKIYSSTNGYKYHMSIAHPGHSGLKMERIKCSDCSHIFVRKGDLIKHLKSVHLQVRYKCKICVKNFSSAQYCQQHEQLHDITGGGESAVLKCDKCPKLYLSVSGLQKHLITKHPHGEAVYNCKKCDASFSHLKAMQLHITLKHRTKPLKCPHCPKLYSKVGGLQKHVMRHAVDSKEIKPEKRELVRLGGETKRDTETKRQMSRYLESRGTSKELGTLTSLHSVKKEVKGYASCEYCGLEFEENQCRRVKVHLSRHKFRCIKCLEVLDHASSMRHHFYMAHKIDGIAAEELLKKCVQPIELVQQLVLKNESTFDDKLDLN